MNLLRDLQVSQVATREAIVKIQADLAAGNVDRANTQLCMLSDTLNEALLALPRTIEQEPKGVLGRLLYLLRHYRVFWGDWGFSLRIVATQVTTRIKADTAKDN